jgi:hypothetical protein
VWSSRLLLGLSSRLFSLGFLTITLYEFATF